MDTIPTDINCFLGIHEKQHGFWYEIAKDLIKFSIVKGREKWKFIQEGLKNDEYKGDYLLTFDQANKDELNNFRATYPSENIEINNKNCSYINIFVLFILFNNGACVFT